MPLLVVTLLATTAKDPYFEIARNLEIFASLYKEVNEYYVDEINPNEVIRNGIDKMLDDLDPYTVYIPEDDIEDYRTMATGEYGGLGALTGQIGDKHVIMMIYEGYPAQEAGLEIGDEIIKVDEVEVAGLSHDELGQLIKGQSGSKVNILINRYGASEPQAFTIERSKIQVDNIAYKGMITEDIGMIKLVEFTRNAGKNVKDATKELKKQGATKIILDLRDNPGGLLHESVNLCNVFIGKDQVVVDTKGKIEDLNKTYRTLDNALDEEIPLVVLINSSSASASEIVAGVVQDYDRGVLVGQKSFGKGLVQATRKLSYNSQLKITTAKYYTPSGRCIQALDYSNRNPDGSVGKVADSLKNTFTTRNGREVYDGGGIDPDVVIDEWKPAPFLSSISHEGHIFNFATKFRAENPTISGARAFSISDETYNDFVQWLQEKDFEYSTRTEETFEQLVASAKKESYYNDIESSLQALGKRVNNHKSIDLQLFKEEIKDVLEEEIVSRYYFEKGIIESTFDDDENILKAVEILNDQELYNSILTNKKAAK